jgi:hypothetical protein
VATVCHWPSSAGVDIRLWLIVAVVGSAVVNAMVASVPPGRTVITLIGGSWGSGPAKDGIGCASAPPLRTAVATDATTTAVARSMGRKRD